MSRPLPAQWQPMIDAAITYARTRIEAGDEIPGLGFIDAPTLPPDVDLPGNPTKGPSLLAGMIVIPMQTTPNKDVWARMVRTLSGFVEARFVMVVSEVWIGPATMTTKEEADAAMAKYGSVQNMPGRREMLMVNLETREGFWLGLAQIVEKPGRHARGGAAQKTFGELKLEMTPHLTGRFAGLLGSRKPKH